MNWCNMKYGGIFVFICSMCIKYFQAREKIEILKNIFSNSESTEAQMFAKELMLMNEHFYYYNFFYATSKLSIFTTMLNFFFRNEQNLTSMKFHVMNINLLQVTVDERRSKDEENTTRDFFLISIQRWDDQQEIYIRKKRNKYKISVNLFWGWVMKKTQISHLATFTL